MLSAPHRLQKQKDFAHAHSRGRFVGGGFLSLKYVKNNLNVTRCAFLVSTKVSKRAVDRNKIKRRLRSIVREKIESVRPGFDIVFFTQKDILNKDYAMLERSVEALLYKARLIV